MVADDINTRRTKTDFRLPKANSSLALNTKNSFHIQTEASTVILTLERVDTLQGILSNHHRLGSIEAS